MSEAVSKALQYWLANGGNKRKIAEKFGIAYTSLYRAIKRNAGK